MVERCRICGGNVGSIPVGGHNLCQELRKRGLPTPSLGEKCTACNGNGRKPRPVVAGVLLPTNPTGREIELWFPKCDNCHGCGRLTV